MARSLFHDGISYFRILIYQLAHDLVMPILCCYLQSRLFIESELLVSILHNSFVDKITYDLITAILCCIVQQIGFSSAWLVIGSVQISTRIFQYSQYEQMIMSHSQHERRHAVTFWTINGYPLIFAIVQKVFHYFEEPFLACHV